MASAGLEIKHRAALHIACWIPYGLVDNRVYKRTSRYPIASSEVRRVSVLTLPTYLGTYLYEVTRHYRGLDKLRFIYINLLKIMRKLKTNSRLVTTLALPKRRLDGRQKYLVPNRLRILKLDTGWFGKTMRHSYLPSPDALGRREIIVAQGGRDAHFISHALSRDAGRAGFRNHISCPPSKIGSLGLRCSTYASPLCFYPLRPDNFLVRTTRKKQNSQR
ncbi:hypothetical protein F4781DRAFT_247374 [Annulohypoxylon bovei var. microspora]|nr:hypothetical protein F4781DRAFT_247374 [Annulohypoxylon bovei var. microspora]